MKGFGFILIFLGIVICYIGIRGYQHNIMNVITGKGGTNSAPQKQSTQVNPVGPITPPGGIGPVALA